MKPQNLHHHSIGDLKSMPLVCRQQALLEWMIEPIVAMEQEKGGNYPFPEEQSNQDREKVVKELTDHLCKVARDQPLPWPSVSEVETAIELTKHSNTKAYMEREFYSTKINLAKTKRRLEIAQLEDPLAETLGAFGAEPLQEFSQRQEAVYYLLCDPRQQRPDFLKDFVAKSERNLASDGTDEEERTLDLKGCPFRTDDLTNINHLKFFMFIYKNRPKLDALISFLKVIKSKTNIDRTNVRDMKSAVNAKLTDCEVAYNSTDRVYEIKPLRA